MNESLILTALRVIGRFGIGLRATSADENVVRDSVAPREREFPITELYYLILKRELKMPKNFSSRIPEKCDLEEFIERLQTERIELDKIIASLEALRASASSPTSRRPLHRRAAK